jgi:acyl-CoA thioesterase FadM
VGVTAYEELAADGYRFVIPAPTVPEDFDRQLHLNNAAIVRVFNDLRIAYVVEAVGEWWRECIVEQRYVVAARELHVLYESEGQPGESFVGAMRYTRRDGKALILEERLAEADTGRAIARAWLVQLIVRDGAVVDWPERYVARVAEIEGRAFPTRTRASAPRWGPAE